MFLSQYLYPTQPQPPAKKTPAAAQETKPSPAAAASASPESAKEPQQTAAPLPLAPGATPQQVLPNVRIDNGRYQLSISNQGATVREWVLLNFKGNDGKPLQLLNTVGEAPPVFSLYFPSLSATERDTVSKAVNWSFYQPTVDADGLGVTYEFSNGHLAAKKVFPLREEQLRRAHHHRGDHGRTAASQYDRSGAAVSAI